MLFVVEIPLQCHPRDENKRCSNIVTFLINYWTALKCQGTYLSTFQQLLLSFTTVTALCAIKHKSYIILLFFFKYFIFKVTNVWLIYKHVKWISFKWYNGILSIYTQHWPSLTKHCVITCFNLQHGRGGGGHVTWSHVGQLIVPLSSQTLRLTAQVPLTVT